MRQEALKDDGKGTLMGLCVGPSYGSLDHFQVVECFYFIFEAFIEIEHRCKKICIIQVYSSMQLSD